MAEQPRILNALNVNVHDRPELLEFLRQDAERAGARLRAAIHDLQDRGIIDTQGNRIRPDTPVDLLPGSEA